MAEIRYYNRHEARMETEQVYGEGFLKFSYENPLGYLPLHLMVKRAAFSRWYGKRMDQPKTRAKIAPFLAKYGLDAGEFADAPESYRHFNDFFYRKLKPSARPLAESPVVFPADGRHLGFQHADEIQGVFVKNQRFDLAELLGDAKLAEQYAHGALVLSRLCPVDYHRFHFPVAGIAGKTRLINGPLFSVSPIALGKNLSYLWQNKRTITAIKTESLGTVLMLEIGATCVGSIHQTFTAGQRVEKGQEKGYFAFGGSSTITIFEPGTVELSADLVEHSSQQIELYARMGSELAQAVNPA